MTIESIDKNKPHKVYRALCLNRVIITIDMSITLSTGEGFKAIYYPCFHRWTQPGYDDLCDYGFKLTCPKCGGQDSFVSEVGE